MSLIVLTGAVRSGKSSAAEAALAAAARDKVNQMLESTYKRRHPEDATLAGLQKLLQDKQREWERVALRIMPLSPDLQATEVEATLVARLPGSLGSPREEFYGLIAHKLPQA